MERRTSQRSVLDRGTAAMENESRVSTWYRRGRGEREGANGEEAYHVGNEVEAGGTAPSVLDLDVLG
jgi:hypothetical protein